MAIERLKAVSVNSGEHRGPCGFCWFCHGEAQFYGNDKFKNAEYCNALRFLTAKYLYTCANSVDPDHTAPGEDIYLHIAIVCAYLSWIILW